MNTLIDSRHRAILPLRFSSVENMKSDPLARRFGENLSYVRKDRGLKQSDVVDRLKLLGLDLRLNLISKMENGNRMPDLRELLALSIALGVAPSRLFISRTADTETNLDLTPTVRAAESSTWVWAAGDVPLSKGWLPEGIPEPDLYDFREESRPHHPPNRTLAEEVNRHMGKLVKLRSVADELRSEGVPPGAIAAELNNLAMVFEMHKRIAALENEEENRDG